MDNNQPQNDNNPPTPLSQAPVPQPPTPPLPPKSKGGKGKIVAIIGAIIGALALIGGLLWLFLVFLPDYQVKSAANDFVELVKDGKHEDAIKLTNSDEDDEEGTMRLIESLDSSIGDSSYKITSVDKDDSTKLVKYTADEDDDKRFVIGVKDVDGKRKIVSIIIDFKGESSSDTPKDDSDQTVATNTPACLPQASVQKNFRFTNGFTFYFEADTNKVRHEGVAINEILIMKQFYDDNKQYNFTFNIDVSLYQGNADSKAAQDLALLRASVVAYNMNKRGIPYENIRIGKVIYSAGNPKTPQYADGSRTATVIINSECNAQSTPENIDKNIDSSYGL